MVNEIRQVGLASAWDLGSAGGMRPGQTENAIGSQSPGRQGELKVDERSSAFSLRASVKDEAVQIARSVREVDKVLERADGLLQAMREEVRMVKNYPPFPPGNEQRQSFISSINGLRKAMEELTVPPVEGSPQPVFYPQETGLPRLEPATATDLDILAFGQAVEAIQARLDGSLGELQGKVDGLWRQVNKGLPSPPASEVAAMQTGHAAVVQLGQSGRGVLTSGIDIGQMGV